MEFDAIVFGEKYSFSPLTNDSFLITGKQGQYILYKRDIWRCADEITLPLLQKLGEVIDEHRQPVHH
jgi:hypothetical protein